MAEGKEKEKKGVAEKTGEGVGKVGKGISDGTKSFVGGFKKGFGKKKEKEK